ncbi:MAG: peptidylprolyl isomerase [Flavobacteriaceae bacterium]
MINKITLPFIALLLIATNTFSQKKKDVLMTINNDPVYASEFKTVFNKNLDLVIDESQKNVDGYLDLFIDYKLKVAEAYAQDLDKNSVYIREFNNYEDQLSKKYIYDKRLTSELVKEAYDRGLEEINADHILIRVSMNAKPEDSIIAYNKIKSIRDKAINGENFEELAKEYSEEPNAKSRGGKLGYFTSFSMVYPFENAAYNTEVGEVSGIVRTQFGYHIIKVNERRLKQPKVNVSHIMIYDSEKKKNENAEEKINELYAMLMQGETFENVAKQFSEDKNTGIKGGQLKTFGHGELRAPAFEDAAYALTEKGQISKPIKSSFGWHIIRLNEKLPLPSFEESKADLEKKVTGGARATVVTQAVNDKIIDKYGYKEGENYLPYFNTYITDKILNKMWEYQEIPKNEIKVLFVIGNKKANYTDFAKFIEKNQKEIRRYSDKDELLSDYYNKFKDEFIVEFYKERLEEENTEYSTTLSEYRNGLLIFDVMDQNIWKAAKTDSLGLKKYYEETKKDYNWKKRVDVDIISASEESFAIKAQELLRKGAEVEKIKEELNKNDKVNVFITSDIYEIGQSQLPEEFNPKLGVSDIYMKGAYSLVINVKEVIEPSAKEFEEVRGLVLSNYQTVIEGRWMNELHNKYNVVINKKVLKKIKKELNQ